MEATHALLISADPFSVSRCSHPAGLRCGRRRLAAGPCPVPQAGSSSPPGAHSRPWPKAADLSVLAAEANLAPNVHNTQPTRWRLEADDRVLVLEDTSRRLSVGDPSGRDAGVSHGAAIEGFAMACQARGVGVGVEPLDLPEERGLRPVARLRLSPIEESVDRLRGFAPSRRTFRGAFVRPPVPRSFRQLETAQDVRLVRDAAGVARLAKLNDEASLGVFRDPRLPRRAGLLDAPLAPGPELERRRPQR